MNGNQETLINSLQLPVIISNLPRNSVQDFLGISEPTLRRYQNYLNIIKPDGWDYIKGSRGFSRNSIRILCVFKKLVDTLGQAQAIMQIKPTLEELN
jgi:hypothetical protein